ncbi:hypothetical protein D3C85_1620720 [compost metagenome]
MDDLLEFGEHGLTEYRRPELIRVICQQIQLLFRIGSMLQQIIHKQCFIRSRCHFSEEDRVLGIPIFQGLI